MIDKSLRNFWCWWVWPRNYAYCTDFSVTKKDEFVFVDDNPASKLLNGHDVYTYDEFKHLVF